MAAHPRTLAARDFYAGLGLNVLPSEMDRKKPRVKFSHLWESAAPEFPPDRWETTNLQVMTGRRWGLVVVDLDGPEAMAVWDAWVGERGLPRTWESSRDPSKGRHVWLSVSPGPAIPSRFLWLGEGKHSAVEILADRKLVVAPPSRHVKTGQEYAFLPGRKPSPYLSRPSPCPPWVLALPDVSPPSVVPARPELTVNPVQSNPTGVSAEEVRSSISNPVDVLRGWGVRVCPGNPSPTGWLDCRSIYREDRNPSARVSARGSYWEPGMPKPLSLFDVGVELGLFASWKECKDHLAELYCGRKAKR